MTHLSVNILYIIALPLLQNSCGRERTINWFLAPSSAQKATLQPARVDLAIRRRPDNCPEDPKN